MIWNGPSGPPYYLLDHWGDEDEWEIEFFEKFCA